MRRQSLVHLLAIVAVFMVALNMYTFYSLYRGQLWKITDSQKLRNNDTLSITSLTLDSEFLLWRENHVTSNKKVLSLRFVSEDPSSLIRVRILCPKYLRDNPVLLIAHNVFKRLQKTPSSSQKKMPVHISSIKKLKRAFSGGNTSFDNEMRSLTFGGTIWKNVKDWPVTNPLSIHNIGQVIQFASKANILRATSSKKGTQLKVEVFLQGGQLAFFKPKRYDKNIVLKGTPFAGLDRHFGEISAFYLSQILEYNNAPVVLGRIVQLKKEIWDQASTSLSKTFYEFDNGSVCFYGECQFCKPENPVCTSNGTIEGSLSLLLHRQLKGVKNPWKRIYAGTKVPDWQIDIDFCEQAFKNMSRERRIDGILDITAISIFDFLIGNSDRHHFESTKDFHPKSHGRGILLIDNGKSFGNAYEDYFDILAPLYQCCRIRESLLKILKSFTNILGTSLKSLTEVDPLFPLLHEDHFRALDRRLAIILATVHYCIDDNRNKFRLIRPKKLSHPVVY